MPGRLSGGGASSVGRRSPKGLGPKSHTPSHGSSTFPGLGWPSQLFHISMEPVQCSPLSEALLLLSLRLCTACSESQEDSHQSAYRTPILTSQVPPVSSPAGGILDVPFSLDSHSSSITRACQFSLQHSSNPSPSPCDLPWPPLKS